MCAYLKSFWFIKMAMLKHLYYSSCFFRLSSLHSRDCFLRCTRCFSFAPLFIYSGHLGILLFRYSRHFVAGVVTIWQFYLSLLSFAQINKMFSSRSSAFCVCVCVCAVWAREVCTMLWHTISSDDPHRAK